MIKVSDHSVFFWSETNFNNRNNRIWGITVWNTIIILAFLVWIDPSLVFIARKSYDYH